MSEHKVLVVDDDREIVGAIAKMLELEGIDAVKAYNGAEAVEMLNSTDKILGLSVGADDYVTKPFSPPELMARVKSQLRRYTSLGDYQNKGSGDRVILGGLMLRKDEHLLYVDGSPVKLTAKEYGIVELLMTNAGRVFSAEEIYEKIWNESAYSVENTVMVHIRQIREKIEINPKEPKYLKVVWGVGYKMEKIKQQMD